MGLTLFFETCLMIDSMNLMSMEASLSQGLVSEGCLVVMSCEKLGLIIAAPDLPYASRQHHCFSDK